MLDSYLTAPQFCPLRDLAICRTKSKRLLVIYALNDLQDTPGLLLPFEVRFVCAVCVLDQLLVHDDADSFSGLSAIRDIVIQLPQGQARKRLIQLLLNTTSSAFLGNTRVG
jgi:hypothetical protein